MAPRTKRYLVEGVWKSGNSSGPDEFSSLKNARVEMRWLLGLPAIECVYITHQVILTTKTTHHTKKAKA